MYDIKQLETQWDSYNKKRRRPFYLISTTVIIVAAVGVLSFIYKDMILSKFDAISAKVPVVESKAVYRDKSITKVALKKNNAEDALLAEELKPVTINTQDNNPMNPEDILIEVREEQSRSAHKPKNVIVNKPRKKMHLVITEMSGASAIQDVKNRFSMAPDPDDSLFLARNYYKDGKYSKAAYWALQTNKLNGDIEESWLIFARSKAKTGHKNEAIRVLTQYVDKSHSIEAKKLLKKFKN